jgi:hypothetical protein
MDLLLATNHLGLGGSESYLFTVAEQLDRLGHGVLVFAPEPGEGLTVAAERGIDVVDEAGLPESCDAVLVQDAGVSLQLAGRYPTTPQVLVAHSESFNLQAPPQLPGIVGAVVALNDRVAARMRSFAVSTRVVRLRQPIDTERFVPGDSLPAVATRALMLSNNPVEDRWRVLESACAQAGLTLARTGGVFHQSHDVRASLDGAEVVIGYGRAILEAMSCGRAAYVYDWNGGEGWVTEETYPAIEADGIAGRSAARVIDAEQLVADLRRYDPAMGPVNRDLVIAHHRANVHAQELVELIGELGPVAERPRAPVDEMARLVRMEWRARGEISSLRRDNEALRKLLKENIDHVHRVEASYEQTLSWRVTRPLRGISRLLARRRG